MALKLLSCGRKAGLESILGISETAVEMQEQAAQCHLCGEHYQDWSLLDLLASHSKDMPHAGRTGEGALTLPNGSSKVTSGELIWSGCWQALTVTPCHGTER